MKKYKGFEVTAINTNGFWYGYARANCDGNTEVIFNDTEGFRDREIAIARAEVKVNEYRENIRNEK